MKNISINSPPDRQLLTGDVDGRHVPIRPCLVSSIQTWIDMDCGLIHASINVQKKLSHLKFFVRLNLVWIES
jgi:hypothetical protein